VVSFLDLVALAMSVLVFCITLYRVVVRGKEASCRSIGFDSRTLELLLSVIVFAVAVGVIKQENPPQSVPFSVPFSNGCCCADEPETYVVQR
jgi:hypothetical protein